MSESVCGAPISDRDEMFVGDAGRYEAQGRSALECVEQCLAAVERSGVDTVLDLPCGHGRVLRHLRRRFPDAAFTACDLDSDGVAFCERHFGARGIVSREDLASVDLGGPYDLIWCGSLLTHLDHPGWQSCYDAFIDVLADRGVLIFTTGGRWVAELARSGVLSYNLPPERLASVLAAFDAHGFGYADYEHQEGYGLSMCSPGWLIGHLETRRDGRIALFSERAWDDHQDVVAIERVC